MAEMIWCQSCQTVVWAFDAQKPVDLRGICNMLQLPCPECGKAGNFDGFAFDSLERFKGIPQVCDDWSAMRYVADTSFHVKWEPSGDNTWFKRPYNHRGNYGYLMASIAKLVADKNGVKPYHY